jgi:hypothetical protein
VYVKIADCPRGCSDDTSRAAPGPVLVPRARCNP